MKPIQHVTDTALWVAVHRAREGFRPDALFKDPLSIRLAGERGQEIAERMSGQSFMSWMMAMRTVAIDDLIKDAIHDGVTRVLNLGAGLDTRPYRMEIPAHVEWIEVDFAGTIEHKNRVLAEERPNIPVQRVALDLSQRPLAQKFFESLALDPRPTVVLTEGVIPYLPPEKVGDLADDLLKTSSIKYWIQDYREGGYASGIPKLWLRWRMSRAPFLFDVKHWFDFFAGHGWRLKSKLTLLEESKRYNRELCVPDWMGFLSFLIPKKRMENYTKNVGVAMLQRSEQGNHMT